MKKAAGGFGDYISGFANSFQAQPGQPHPLAPLLGQPGVANVLRPVLGMSGAPGLFGLTDLLHRGGSGFGSLIQGPIGSAPRKQSGLPTPAQPSVIGAGAGVAGTTTGAVETGAQQMPFGPFGKYSHDRTATRPALDFSRYVKRAT